MVVGKRIPVVSFSCDCDPDHKKLEEEVKKIRSISHYTDLESLFCILEGKSIKANSIRFVDDQKEQQYLSPLLTNGEALPYVSCFDCCTDENIPLWNMYAKDNYGIRLRLDCGCNVNGIIDANSSVSAIKIGDKKIDFNQMFFRDDKKEYPTVWVKTGIKKVNLNP